MSFLSLKTMLFEWKGTGFSHYDDLSQQSPLEEKSQGQVRESETMD